MNPSTQYFVVEPGVTTAVVTGIACLAKNFVSSKHNPFRAPYKAIATVAFGVDLIARVLVVVSEKMGLSIARSSNYKFILREAVSLAASPFFLSLLSKKFLAEYFPSLGLIDKNGMLAIAATIFVARNIAEVETDGTIKIGEVKLSFKFKYPQG